MQIQELMTIPELFILYFKRRTCEYETEGETETQKQTQTEEEGQRDEEDNLSVKILSSGHELTVYCRISGHTTTELMQLMDRYFMNSLLKRRTYLLSDYLSFLETRRCI